MLRATSNANAIAECVHCIEMVETADRVFLAKATAQIGFTKSSIQLIDQSADPRAISHSKQTPGRICCSPLCQDNERRPFMVPLNFSKHHQE
jgi:hypothetical protein